jgi:hypothetical protein
MRLIAACFICFALACCGAFVGCGGAPQQTVIDLPPQEPLTIEEWKSLPVDKKYENYAFERLRLGDPKLKSDAAWDAFMREVIVPERKKDIP